MYLRGLRGSYISRGSFCDYSQMICRHNLENLENPARHEPPSWARNFSRLVTAKTSQNSTDMNAPAIERWGGKRSRERVANFLKNRRNAYKIRHFDDLG